MWSCALSRAGVRESRPAECGLEVVHGTFILLKAPLFALLSSSARAGRDRPISITSAAPHPSPSLAHLPWHLTLPLPLPARHRGHRGQGQRCGRPCFLPCPAHRPRCATGPHRPLHDCSPRPPAGQGALQRYRLPAGQAAAPEASLEAHRRCREVWTPSQPVGPSERRRRPSKRRHGRRRRPQRRLSPSDSAAAPAPAPPPPPAPLPSPPPQQRSHSQRRRCPQRRGARPADDPLGPPSGPGAVRGRSQRRAARGKPG